MVMVDRRSVVKRELILSLGMALGLGQSVRADEPAAPVPQALGSVEAILDKCAQVDPANAARYHGQLEMVTQGADSKSLAKVRESDDYRQAYDSATLSLAGIAEADAVKTCQGSLVASQ
jgi:hypothetical protein